MRKKQQQHLLCKECAPVITRRLPLAGARRRRPLIGGEVTGVRLRLDPRDPPASIHPGQEPSVGAHPHQRSGLLISLPELIISTFSAGSLSIFAADDAAQKLVFEFLCVMKLLLLLLFGLLMVLRDDL